MGIIHPKVPEQDPQKSSLPSDTRTIAPQKGQSDDVVDGAIQLLPYLEEWLEKGVRERMEANFRAGRFTTPDRESLCAAVEQFRKANPLEKERARRKDD